MGLPMHWDNNRWGLICDGHYEQAKREWGERRVS